MEIDLVVVITHQRILQNSRVCWNGKFFVTDQRLVVTTLMVHARPLRISTRNFNIIPSRSSGKSRGSVDFFSPLLFC